VKRETTFGVAISHNEDIINADGADFRPLVSHRTRYLQAMKFNNGKNNMDAASAMIRVEFLGVYPFRKLIRIIKTFISKSVRVSWSFVYKFRIREDGPGLVLA